MNTITQQAKEYTNTNIEFFDSDGNPCVQPAFVAGANYVLDEIEKVIKLNPDCLIAIHELGKLVIQLKNNQ